MKKIPFNAIFLLLLFSFSVEVSACDSRKIGEFVRGYDNTTHAGSFCWNTLNIACKDNVYKATLLCEGEDPIGKVVRDGYEFTEFKPYSHSTNVKMTITNENFSIVIPDEASNICKKVPNIIKGTYRYSSEGDELLVDGVPSTEFFTKRKK